APEPTTLPPSNRSDVQVIAMAHGPDGHRFSQHAVAPDRRDLHLFGSADPGELIALPGAHRVSLIDGAAAYSASLTWSPHVALLPFSSTSSIARCVMNRVGAAPCQWSSPGSKNTRSPGRITSIGPPRRCARPIPSMTKMVWPFGWVCHAVRAAGVKWTLLALWRDWPAGVATESTYTAPVNHSLGPAMVSMPFRVTCIASASCLCGSRHSGCAYSGADRDRVREWSAPRLCFLGMSAFFGFHMPNFTFPGVPNDKLFDHVVKNAKAAEKAGFDLVTVMDHFYQIRGIGPETEPMMEAYATLSALATQTSRVKLGTLVTGVTYRNPALLVKEVTTLDIISKGRAIFGIGAAWNEDEHRGYGYEFPPIGRRMDRLGEALTIAKLMFTQDRPSFEGKYYKIDRALNVPRPIQPGGPKILIGGGGEQRTLRLLAEHGDIGHWFGGNLEDRKRKKQVFEKPCAAVNRDPSEVLLTVGLTLVLAENDK